MRGGRGKGPPPHAPAKGYRKKMAAVTVGFNGTRFHDMGDTDGTTGVGNIGGGAGAGSEPDFVYQGSNSISRKIGTTYAGFSIDGTAFTPARTIDLRTDDTKIWFIKAIATNKDALLDYPSGGANAETLTVRISNVPGTGSQVSDYAIRDLNDYPIKGGWVLEGLAVCPEFGTISNRSVQLETTIANGGISSISPGVIEEFGIQADFSATSKGENLALDAVDIGAGLYVTGGDGVDADATWADLVETDQGSSSNRWGCVTETDGIISTIGQLVIGATTVAGTTTACVFTDSGKTVVYPRTFCGEISGIILRLDNASTAVSMTDMNFLCPQPTPYVAFNSSTDVEATNDTLSFTDRNIRDIFRVGAQVDYSRGGGGTEAAFATAGSRYVGYPTASGTENAITLHATRANALTNTSPDAVTVSTTANQEVQYLSADLTSVGNYATSRPTLFVTGESGTANFDNCLFDNWRAIDDTSTTKNLTGLTFDNCTFLELGPSNVHGAEFDNCFVSGSHKVDTSGTTTFTSTLTTDNLADISNCTFELGADSDYIGAAIEITTAGTYTFTNNSFLGKWAQTGTQSSYAFDGTTDVNTTSDRITLPAGHGYVDGDPVFYSKGATANTRVPATHDEGIYFVKVFTNDIELYRNQGGTLAGASDTPEALTQRTGTHYLFPANAAIYNSSGGLVTINASEGTSFNVINGIDGTSVVNNNVNVTFDGLQDNTEVRVYEAGTSNELDGIENATAGSPGNRNFTASVSAGTSVDYVLHNLEYEYIRVENFTWPSSVQTIQVQQRLDRNYDNP